MSDEYGQVQTPKQKNSVNVSKLFVNHKSIHAHGGGGGGHSPLPSPRLTFWDPSETENTHPPVWKIFGNPQALGPLGMYAWKYYRLRRFYNHFRDMM